MSALIQARRVVVKVGSALLLDPAGRVDRDWIAGLAADLAMLVDEGRKGLGVSSGSTALRGRRRLGLEAGEKLDLQTKQAAASAGQSLLMRASEEALEP